MQWNKLTLILSFVLSYHYADALEEEEKAILASPANVEACVKQNKEHFLSYFANESQIDPSFHLWLSPFPSAYVNAVTHFFDQDRESARQQIEYVKECARNHHVPLAWFVGTQNSPTTIGEDLKTHGFVLADHFPAMICFVDEALPFEESNEITIKLLSEQEIATWLEVVGASFGHAESLIKIYQGSLQRKGLNNHEVEHYAGFYKGQMVAAGTLAIHDDWAGFYNIATLPSFRNKGIATRLCSFLMKRAQDLHLKYVVLLAAPKAESLYRHVGFRTVSSIDIYVLK